MKITISKDGIEPSEPSPKRLLIEDALRLHRRLWVSKHPSFRTPECLLFVEETLTREHVRAFAGLIGSKASSWNGFSESELRVYILALKIEAACFEPDLLERAEQLEIPPISPESGPIISL